MLLEQRARELLALGRAVPACDDLRELEELAPARARALARCTRPPSATPATRGSRSATSRRAREAYEIAASLGAAETDFRLAAAAQPPARVEPGVAERAVLELPLRAVPPFAEIYLDGGAAAGVIETDPTVRRAALERAWRAARQEKMRPLADACTRCSPPRVGSAAAGSDTGAPGATPSAQRLADALLDAPAAPATRGRPGIRRRSTNWVVGSASISTRLLPLLEARAPLTPGRPAPRRRCWRPAIARVAGSSCCSKRIRRRPTCWSWPRSSTASPGASAAPSASSSTWSTSRPIAIRGWCAPPASGSGWGRCGTRARPGCARRAGATSPTIRRGAARSRACGATRARATGAPCSAYVLDRTPPERRAAAGGRAGSRRDSSLAPRRVPLVARRGAGQRPTGGRPSPLRYRR